MSEMIRFILESEFDIKVSVYDNFLAKSFLRKINLFANEKIPNHTLEEICKEKLVLKEIGDFETEKSKYNHGKEKTLKLIKKITQEKSRLLLHEKVLLYFPDYLEINFKMINIIMNESGYLSIPCRYYIAIMVIYD